MKSEVDFYVELLELLSKKPSVRQVKVLRYINENRRFCVPEMTDAMDMQRGDVYSTVRLFLKRGLIEKIPRPQLPEGADEWSAPRRRKYMKRVGITQRQYYMFNPKNMIKLIDRKIERLKTMKTQLLEEGD